MAMLQARQRKGVLRRCAKGPCDVQNAARALQKLVSPICSWIRRGGWYGLGEWKIMIEHHGNKSIVSHPFSLTKCKNSPPDTRLPSTRLTLRNLRSVCVGTYSRTDKSSQRSAEHISSLTCSNIELPFLYDSQHWKHPFLFTHLYMHVQVYFLYFSMWLLACIKLRLWWLP